MATNIAYGWPAAAMMFVILVPAGAGADPAGEVRDNPTCRYCPDYRGTTGWVEAGAGYQDEDSAPFGRYTGLDDEGFHGVLNGRIGHRGGGGRYLDMAADDLGLESRRLGLEGGIQGRFDLSLEYDEIPNHRDRTSFSPFRGDSRLTLPAGWVPGATTGNLPNLGRDLRRTELETQRERLGIGFRLMPESAWEVFGHVRREEKDGTQDLGASFGFNQTVILPAAVDYETDDFSFGVGYNGHELQARVAYDGSVFRNDDSAITWQNPFVAPGANTGFGRLAGAPDNEFHQLSAMLGYALGKATRLNAKFALGRMTQDDSFLPHSINPLFAGNVLAANDLDGEVNTTLAEVRVTSRLTPRLRVSADFTYSDRDNDSERRQWDYVVTDLVDPAGTTRVNTPYGFTQNLARLKAAYRLPQEMEVQGGFEYDRMERTFQSVNETEDRTVWGQVRFRPAPTVETSFKLSHADRDASTYRPVAHITDFNEIQNPLMRIHNLTDRTRDKVSGTVSWMMTPAVTLAVDVDFYRDDYDDTQWGLQKANGRMVSVDASFFIREGLTASAFFTNDRMESDQAGRTFWSGNPADQWMVDDRYNTDTFGVGLNWTPLPNRLDLSADFTYSEFRGDIDYADGTGPRPSYPRLKTDITALNLRGDYHIDARQSVVVRWRYEHYDEEDWARDGVVNSLATVLDLGREPFDDEAVMASVAYRYRFD